MRKSKSSSRSKRRTSPGRSASGTSDARSRDVRNYRDFRDDEVRYGTPGDRMGSRSARSDYERMEFGRSGSDYGGGDYGRSDYNREGMRTISGRYSYFEDDSGSSRDWQSDRDSERGFSRAGRSREYSSGPEQEFYEGNAGRSPWRDTYESERDNSSRRSARSQNYRGQGRGYTEFDYDDERVNPRGSRYASSHSYNDESDLSREARYGSYRDPDERWMNNYDNRNDDIDSEYGYRERYNENRY